MARTAAVVALIALVALSVVADVSAEFCRVSAYAVDPDKVTANKNTLFKACGTKLLNTPKATMSGKCAVIVQKVADKEAWDKHSKCEKEEANSKAYGPLKAGSEACSSLQSSGKCPSKKMML